MAPEMIKTAKEDDQAEVSNVDGELKYPFKVDVYSFGMVCFEILTGDLPFPTLSPHEVKIQVLNGARPQLPDQCPDKLRFLIEACWTSEPDKRPRFDDICAELKHLKCLNVITSAWASEEDRLNGSSHIKQFFSFEELYRATQGFSAKQRLARGSVASVFTGILADGREIAVRVPEDDGTQDVQQCLNEVISSTRGTRRLIPVQLLGCCMKLCILVYEYKKEKSRQIAVYLLI